MSLDGWDFVSYYYHIIISEAPLHPSTVRHQHHRKRGNQCFQRRFKFGTEKPPVSVDNHSLRTVLQKSYDRKYISSSASTVPNMITLLNLTPCLSLNKTNKCVTSPGIFRD
eukprot:22769_1